jgi:TPR repeat protein
MKPQLWISFLLLLVASAAGEAEGLVAAKAAYVAGDYDAAFREFKKLADRNDPVGQFAVGVMYANGESVKNDEVEAVRWVRRAADQGYSRRR